MTSFMLYKYIFILYTASHLITRAYDPFCSGAETKEQYEQSVASLFYEEAQSVCRNCYIFNTGTIRVGVMGLGIYFLLEWCGFCCVRHWYAITYHLTLTPVCTCTYIYTNTYTYTHTNRGAGHCVPCAKGLPLSVEAHTGKWCYIWYVRDMNVLYIAVY